MTLRAPGPGRVKTRLAAGLGRETGDEAAAALYRAFVADELAALDTAGLPVTAFVHPPQSVAACRDWLEPGRSVLPQQGGDLGARMANAFLAAFEGGAQAALLVGGDLPELSKAHLDAALAALADGVPALAPSLDGGYTLIALPPRAFAPTLFEDVDWGTPLVLEQTLTRFSQARLAPRLLPPLPDVDTADDLAALAARWRGRQGGPAHTLAALRALGLFTE